MGDWYLRWSMRFPPSVGYSRQCKHHKEYPRLQRRQLKRKVGDGARPGICTKECVCVSMCSVHMSVSVYGD